MDYQNITKKDIDDLLKRSELLQQDMFTFVEEIKKRAPNLPYTSIREVYWILLITSATDRIASLEERLYGLEMILKNNTQ